MAAASESAGTGKGLIGWIDQRFPLTKLWNFEDIRESRDHENTRLSTNHRCSPGLLDLLTRRFAEFIGFHRQFFGQFSTP